MTKHEVILAELQRLKSAAANRGAGNTLIETIAPIQKLVEARRTVNQDPDTNQLPAMYEQVAAAVDSFNATNTITIPTEAEFAALVVAADSVEA